MTHISNTTPRNLLAAIAAQAERDHEAKKTKNRQQLVKYLVISNAIRRKRS